MTFSSSVVFLLPVQLLLVVIGAVFIILSQCCGGGSKKKKPKAGAAVPTPQTSAAGGPPGAAEAPSSVKSSEKSGGSKKGPAPKKGAAAKKGPPAAAAKKPSPKGKAPPPQKKSGKGSAKGPMPPAASKELVPQSEPNYGTLAGLDKEIFTKEQQAKGGMPPPPMGAPQPQQQAPGPAMTPTTDPNYGTLKNLDADIFTKNAPPSKPAAAQKAGPPQPQTGGGGQALTPTLSKWVHTPSKNGQPKRLHCHDYCGRLDLEWVNNLKETFLRAISSVSYIIRIDHVGIMPTVEPFESVNERTKEKLTLEKVSRYDDVVNWLLKRCPIIVGETEATVQWENDKNLDDNLNNVKFELWRGNHNIGPLSPPRKEKEEAGKSIGTVV
ncbi:hypothetical protein niasHT_027458 [Heterodera trifolii]|uniref:Uncharacterized protein n=1 Tax=Heterodera trifolii TaxID=157864 RepID=A0ABD2JS50_9BILA